MPGKKYVVRVRIGSKDPPAIGRRLPDLVPGSEVTWSGGGDEFLLEGAMEGTSARELDRALQRTLRLIDPHLRWRSEWRHGTTTERYSGRDLPPVPARKRSPTR